MPAWNGPRPSPSELGEGRAPRGNGRAPRGNWVASLRRFVVSGGAERCELCGGALGPGHAHLIQPANRRVLCVCRGCAAGPSFDRAYRLVPDRVRLLDGFRISDAEWESLNLPIDMAFLFRSTPLGRTVALYPGPAGATESQLGLDAWAQLVARNPVLAELEADVEALLVNRVSGAREYYRVPIDHCYALVGLIRTRWRGLSGGDEAWEAIRRFFAGLRDPAAMPREWVHG